MKSVSIVYNYCYLPFIIFSMQISIPLIFPMQLKLLIYNSNKSDERHTKEPSAMSIDDWSVDPGLSVLLSHYKAGLRSNPS